jgi:hypothetical protein
VNKATKWGINIAANEGKEKTVIVVVLLFEVIFCEGVISNLDYLIPSLSSLIVCNSLCCQLVQKNNRISLRITLPHFLPTPFIMSGGGGSFRF